jgi:hypothetical protein
MKRLFVFLLGFAGVVLLLIAVQPTAAQSDVIVNNADATWTNALGRSNPLATLLSQVVTRVVQGEADANRNELLSNAPAGLRTLLNQVPVRVFFDSADGSRTFSLLQLPATLRDAVAGTALRTVVDMANGTRVFGLNYPRVLLNDQTPPAMLKPMLERVANGAVDLVWATDEFTSVVVRYGPAPGAYTQEKRDSLFAKAHRLRFTDLQPGVTYYFQFVSTDLSGNSATSTEYSLTYTVTIPLYLPQIRR